MSRLYLAASGYLAVVNLWLAWVALNLYFCRIETRFSSYKLNMSKMERTTQTVFFRSYFVFNWIDLIAQVPAENRFVLIAWLKNKNGEQSEQRKKNTYFFLF